MEVWACLLQILQEFEKRRVLGPPVGIKEVQPVWRPVMVGLPYDAGKRCNSDSTSKEHGRFSGILMQGERAHCRVHLHSGAKWHFFQRPLKCCVSHAGREHELVFKWSAGDGKSADISFGVG